MQELPRNQREFGDLGEHGGTGDSQGDFWDAGSSRGIRGDFLGGTGMSSAPSTPTVWLSRAGASGNFSRLQLLRSTFYSN